MKDVRIGSLGSVLQQAGLTVESVTPEACSRPKVDSNEGAIAFLEPCWGFADDRAFRAYFGGLDPAIRNDRDRLAPMTVGGKTYTPRFTLNFGGLNTSDFFRRPSSSEWMELRKRAVAKPAGAYNVAMLVSGPRQYFRHCHQTTKHPKWWYRLVSGRRDCFVVWRNAEGGCFDNVNEARLGVRTNFARSGRGVIFTIEARYDHSGRLVPDLTSVEIVLVRFSIFDRDTDKDDMMRVETRCFSDLDNVDSGLSSCSKEMVEAARRGYLYNCRHTPQETSDWLQFFLNQRTKLEADRWTSNGSSFRAKMETFGNDWRGALAEVREAWQLNVFASVHGRNSELWDVPGSYPGANGQRLMKAVNSAQSDMRRWQELRRMVTDFVEPSDGLWDYTGD